MGIPSYRPKPRPRQTLMPSPYLDEVIGELPEKNPMWPIPQGVGDIGPMPPPPQMTGPPPGPMGPPPQSIPPQSLPPEDPYLTDQIREQTQLSPIKPPPPMPMQMPGPDPKSPQSGQFRASNVPPTGPGMPPIPPPDNARQPQTPTTTPELEHYRMIADQRPEPARPKWWQTLAAGTVGGLEGYLASSPSAAIRSSVRQPGRLSQMINEGDYPQRLANWQMDLKNAQDMLEASMDVQKARAQQQVQEAQAWRYKNEPLIKADTALDVQESRNQGQIAKVGAVSAGVQATNEAKYRHTLKPVTPEKAAELQAAGYEQEGENDAGQPLFSAATLANHNRAQITRERMDLDFSLGQDKIKSAEAITDENRKSRESLARYNQGQSWARQEARIRADLQKAQARGETGEFEKEKLENMAKIENAYHKAVTDLAKQYKFAEAYNEKTADSLTGAAAEGYWSARHTIEKKLREDKNRAERLYARQKGVNQPYVYPPETGETYAEKKLAEIRGMAQGAPAAAQSGQPTPTATPAPRTEAQPTKLKLPQGFRLPVGYTETPDGTVRGPGGRLYRIDPQANSLKPIR